MKEKPILFSPPMVLAILQRRKSQTRRVIDPQPAGPDVDFVYHGGGEWRTNGMVADCKPGKWTEPYSKGDRLYVKEAWATSKSMDHLNGTQIAERCNEAGYEKPWCPIRYKADGAGFNWTDPDQEIGRPRHARFMPRWASRLTLEVTRVRAERLQDISEGDAAAEGIISIQRSLYRHGRMDGYGVDGTPPEDAAPTRVAAYAQLWATIHKEADHPKWADNPWVFVYDFKVVR
jgi:hypothetical protein